MKGRKLVMPPEQIIDAILKYQHRVFTERDRKKTKHIIIYIFPYKWLKKINLLYIKLPQIIFNCQYKDLAYNFMQTIIHTKTLSVLNNFQIRFHLFWLFIAKIDSNSHIIFVVNFLIDCTNACNIHRKY